MLVAQATTGETITIAAVMGVIWGVVQLASLVFKRKGEADPGIAEIRRDLKAIKEDAKLAAEAVIVQRFSVMTELAQINQLAHETRTRVEGAYLAVEDLRKLVEGLSHNVRGNSVPGLMQRQAVDDIKIEHMEEDIKKMKNEK